MLVLCYNQRWNNPLVRTLTERKPMDTSKLSLLVDTLRLMPIAAFIGALYFSLAWSSRVKQFRRYCYVAVGAFLPVTLWALMVSYFGLADCLAALSVARRTEILYLGWVATAGFWASLLSFIPGLLMLWRVRANPSMFHHHAVINRRWIEKQRASREDEPVVEDELFPFRFQ